MKKNRALLALLLTAIFLSIASCAKDDVVVVTRERFLMGTVIRIKVPVRSDEERPRAEEAITKALDEVARIEALFSVYKPASDIARINRLHSWEVLKISDEACALIEKAIEYNKKTEGAFDITVKPLVDLWQRAKADKRMPADEEVKETLAKVGSQAIVLDKKYKTISFGKEGMAIDMGGVAKGYATDRAINVLRNNGITSAIVDSGGDMYCLGKRSEKEMWHVGIQHPREKGGVLMELKLENRAADTSGDYEKYFTLDGKRYSHIIDPRTGYPIGDDMASATVIARDSATADMLATALCVLGRRGKDIITPADNVEVVMVLKEGDILKVEMTEGVARWLER